jgi:hypothetical protein
MEMMTGAPHTSPEDVGVMACEIAKTVEKSADSVLDMVEGMARKPEHEPVVEKQVRLVLEQQTHDIAEKIKAWCPAGVGFMLFLMDYGTKGNLAYVSTIDRDAAIGATTQWLVRLQTGKA